MQATAGQSGGVINGWSIDRKVTKELRSFDGGSMHVKSWRDRILDHLVRCNVSWGDVLGFVEKESTPLTWARLQTVSRMLTEPTHGYVCDLPTISKTL